MVSFILSCLDRGFICSQMFQGREKLRESRGCRGQFSVTFSLSSIFTIMERATFLPAELKVEAGFSLGFFGSGTDQESWFFMSSFLSDSFQWSASSIFRTMTGVFPLALRDIHLTHFIFSFPCWSFLDGWARNTSPASNPPPPPPPATTHTHIL